ncbi:MAG: LysR family transcriptional regulator [Geminicoccaceae bacterium]
MRYFLAVCETENFTRASEVCNVAQPSLSKAIRKLEEEFGGALFHRERNRSLLTELGRRMRPYLAAMVEASEAARMDALDLRKEVSSTIRLGVMSTIAPTHMVGFLARLRETVPDLDLRISEAGATDLVAQLQEDLLDAALLALPELPPGLYRTPLYDERYTIAFPAGHPFARQNAISIETLNGIDYLKRIHCEFMEHFESLCGPQSLGQRPLFERARTGFRR